MSEKYAFYFTTPQESLKKVWFCHRNPRLKISQKYGEPEKKIKQGIKKYKGSTLGDFIDTYKF